MNIPRHLTYILFSLAFVYLTGTSQTQASPANNKSTFPTVESVLDSLDHLIGERYRFTQQKETQIREIKQKLKNQLNPAERFQIMGNLIDAYRAFSIDSQTVYVKRQIELADNRGTHDMQIQARLNMVECLYTAGMYKEADELLTKTERKQLPHYILPYYYHLKRTLYGLLADYALQPEIRDNYTQMLNLYRDSILQANPSTSFTYSVRVISVPH